jgi:DNA helicase-2/ATP-dependent DNA helicase PcrA
VDAVLDHTGYRRWLEGLADGPPRLAALAAFRALAAHANGDLAAWLAQLALDPPGAELEPDGVPSGTGGRLGRVLLTTVHGAKGGEWPAVFVVGVEEGLLPHARSLAQAGGPTGPLPDALPNQDALMEELRLAFVAVTRARRLLYVTYCRTRRRGDRLVPRRPSRFLSGLPLQSVTPPTQGTRRPAA